jgi:glycosyltransferase involved in cell wall biosynthesis
VTEKPSATQEGVSIVVCCHNSARLLPETLSNLAAQQLSSPPPSCEVIVVDNASTDDTGKVALECWPDDCPIPLRIVLEPRLGLSHARLRGIAEAKYSVVCFVDDDNLVNNDWAEIVSRVMSEHPEVGACGGQVEAQCEVAQPLWFERFQNYYAVGRQAEQEGDITDTRGYLWGAGLCLRKKALDGLVENGFSFLLTDRKGEALSSGGDAELCYALKLTGWRLWYEPQLRLRHFLTAPRLQWKYLRRISRGFGAATAGIDAYEMAFKEEPGTFVERLRRTWGWQTLATVWRLLRQPVKLLQATLASGEGDASILKIENLWGRLLELLRHRRSYASNLRRIQNKMSDKL